METPETASFTGTYTTAGNTLTLTSAGEAPEDIPYCVQGNTLSLLRVDSTSGATTVDLIATK
jgi:hypothetical protein